MLINLETRFNDAWPATAWSDVTCLTAVSGGPDSVALLLAMVRLRPASAAGQIVVAHYNHRWRGAESDGDEAFVRDLAASLGLTCQTGHADRLATSEESARDQRYDFLATTAHRVGARYVAVGHTADDQAETILFRLLRGTGLSGLTGMPQTRQLSDATTLIRPLLSVRRAAVLGYLEHLQQPYRTDATNRDTRFARNRLRHEILPALQDLNTANVVDNLLQLGRQAAEIVEPIRAEAMLLLDRIGEDRADGVLLHLRRLAEPPKRAVLRELFVELWRRRNWPRGAMSSGRWERLADAALGGTPADATFPGSVRMKSDGALLSLQRLNGDSGSAT